jgi:hypothetical protein
MPLADTYEFGGKCVLDASVVDPFLGVATTTLLMVCTVSATVLLAAPVPAFSLSRLTAMLVIPMLPFLLSCDLKSSRSFVSSKFW